MNDLIRKYEELSEEMHDLIDEENSALAFFREEGYTFEQALEKYPKFNELHETRKKAERDFYEFEEENLNELLNHY